MQMIKKLILLIVLLISINLHAQTTETNYAERGVIYRYEQTGAILIHTDGFGLRYRTGMHLTGYSKSMLEFEFLSMKNPKETRSINPLYSDAKSYIYGKLNTFSVGRAGVGIQKVINSKARGIKNAVEVRYFYAMGFSAGILKPVYLYIVDFNSGYDATIKTEKYNPTKHYPENIYGRAPFTKGFGELKFHPGGYVKFGLNFDFAPEEENLRSIEIGFNVDAYPKEVPIMALKENKKFFLTFYLSFNLGNQYN